MSQTKPQVTIEMESFQNILMEGKPPIVIELDPEVAPNTVANFVSLVSQGYYNGLIFHRVIPGFMIQGGCPNGSGTAGPDYLLPGEFAENGFENPLKHTRGVISMARGKHPDSAGSQFFIMVEDSPHLDGSYAAFGKVLSGMETVDTIVNADRFVNNRPFVTCMMKSVTVDTFGETFDPPKTLPINLLPPDFE